MSTSHKNYTTRSIYFRSADFGPSWEKVLISRQFINLSGKVISRDHTVKNTISQYLRFSLFFGELTITVITASYFQSSVWTVNHIHALIFNRRSPTDKFYYDNLIPLITEMTVSYCNKHRLQREIRDSF